MGSAMESRRPPGPLGLQTHHEKIHWLTKKIIQLSTIQNERLVNGLEHLVNGLSPEDAFQELTQLQVLRSRMAVDGFEDSHGAGSHTALEQHFEDLKDIISER